MSAGPLVRRYGDTDFVTSLRAIAALLVVVDHTDALEKFGQLGANITMAAKHGVEIFFVISGFTIATTYFSAPSYGNYLTRRMLRIAPPYYAAVITGYLLATNNLMQPMWLLDAWGGELDLRNLAMHLLFVSPLDWRITDSILGVEWTIPIEVFWYAVLPAFLPRLRSAKAFLLYTIAFTTIDMSIRIIAIQQIQQDFVIFTHMFVAKYANYFLLGILAYRLRKSPDTVPDRGKRLAVYLAPIFIMEGLILANSSSGLLVGIGTFLLLSFYWPNNHGTINRWLTSFPLLYLGSISYSIYLTHNMMVLLWLRWGAEKFDITGPPFMLLILSVTIPLSTAMYFVIERPSNRLGKRLADRFFPARAELKQI